jgi:hypothetical protein
VSPSKTTFYYRYPVDNSERVIDQRPEAQWELIAAMQEALTFRCSARVPTAQVTVTDIELTSVADITAGDLGSHPRATVREMDAIAIDAPNGYYDLAVFAQFVPHLPPRRAARVFCRRHPRRQQAADHRLSADAAAAAGRTDGVLAAVGRPRSVPCRLSELLDRIALAISSV